MSEQEHQDKRPQVRYEGGVPILDFGSQLSEVQRRQDEAERRDSEYKSAQISLNRWLVGATIALVISTVAMGGTQTWYMHRQWKLTSDGLSKLGDEIWAQKNAAYASKSASDTADNSLKQAFRPRIALTSPRASITDGKLSLALQVVNYGTTSARNIEWQQATELGVSERLHRPQYKPSKGILETGYPKEIPPGNVGSSPSPIDIGFYADNDLLQQEIDELASERVWATFSVLVTYEDDFGLTHHAETCVQSCGKAGGMRWRYCPWSARND